MLVGEIKVVLGINLAAQSDLQGMTFFDQSFLDGILHRRAVRMRTAEVSAPCVTMGVELNKRNRPEVLVNGAKYRQKDGMISTDADGSRAGAKHVPQLLGDSLVGVFNRKRIDREIAEVSDTPFFERIDLQHRIPGTNHRRLHANIARTETRARTISRSSVERNANQRQVEILRTRNVRQPHECGHAREPWIDQRVHRHGMRLCSFLRFHRRAHYRTWKRVPS